jgi:lipopolysaccharide assembly protein B
VGPALLIIAVIAVLAVGLLLGRYYVPDDRMLRRTARQSRTYMRAVSHLIARDRDAAIIELRKIVEENVEDSEPYFALGALFRAKGEHERAIRVHQALALREKDQRKLHVRAMFELALDFRAAGMPRRATRALEEVLQHEPHHVAALRAIAALYEEQGHFEHAAATVIALATAHGDVAPGGRVLRAHALFVAAAQTAISDGDLDQAKHLLKTARQHDSDSAHFLVAAGELAAARGNLRGAQDRWWAALRMAPGLAPLIMKKFVTLKDATSSSDQSNESANQTELDEPVAAADENYDDIAGRLAELCAELGPRIELVVASAHQQIASAADHGASQRTLASAAESDQATLTALQANHEQSTIARLLQAKIALASGDAESQRQALQALVADDGPLGWATRETWQCNACGVRAATFSWRCESCRRWATLRTAIATEPVPTPVVIAARDRRLDVRAIAALGLPVPSLPGQPSYRPAKPSVLRRASAWLNQRSRVRRDEKKRLDAGS